MHPLVRNLYKEAIYVGRDYPLKWSRLRKLWKKGIRNPKNCQSCYDFVRLPVEHSGDKIYDFVSLDRAAVTVAIPKKMHSKDYPNKNCERELRKAVGKGRYMIREMIGVIQLKKYRSLKRCYGDSDQNNVAMLQKMLAKVQIVEDEIPFKTRDNQKEK